jgi:hypothetical protein
MKIHSQLVNIIIYGHSLDWRPFCKDFLGNLYSGMAATTSERKKVASERFFSYPMKPFQKNWREKTARSRTV